MPSPAEITVSQLSRLIGTPDAPVILDVRIQEDFDLDPDLIPGTIVQPFSRANDLVPTLGDKRVVIVCQKGKKISQGAAAMLRTDGVDAQVLEGGHFGWRDKGLPLIPAKKIPRVEGKNHSLWVTRHRPKIDRIACPWLIRRFIDPNALFLYVAPSEVLAVAEKFSAAAFDVEGAFWSHRDDRCTFDTMLDEFALDIEPLKHLATIIRAADTDQSDLAPQAAGLLAASLGYSRMYKDDLQQLEASMSLYDAFYRWCRDATDEKHDWPMHQPMKQEKLA